MLIFEFKFYISASDFIMPVLNNSPMPNIIRRLIYFQCNTLKKSSDEILNDCLSIPDQGFTVTLNYFKELLTNSSKMKYLPMFGNKDHIKRLVVQD